MSEVEQFLGAAVRLERDSALRYDELADAISNHGQAEVVAFFRQQALYSRRHLAEVETHLGKREPWDGVEPEQDGDPKIYAFPEGESPEATAVWTADGFISVADAMALALDAEERGRAYYSVVAGSTADPEVRVIAEAFAREEAGHVRSLKELIDRIHNSLQKKTSDV
jgi:rubrerythrin